MLNGPYVTVFVWVAPPAPPPGLVVVGVPVPGGLVQPSVLITSAPTTSRERPLQHLTMHPSSSSGCRRASVPRDGRENGAGKAVQLRADPLGTPAVRCRPPRRPPGSPRAIWLGNATRPEERGPGCAPWLGSFGPGHRSVVTRSWGSRTVALQGNWLVPTIITWNGIAGRAPRSARWRRDNWCSSATRWP